MSEKSSAYTQNFTMDFIIGGITSTLVKTTTAPIERVKLLLQTQDVMKNMLKKKYKDIINVFERVPKEKKGYQLSGEAI